MIYAVLRMLCSCSTPRVASLVILSQPYNVLCFHETRALGGLYRNLCFSFILYARL